jgi:hypothetical protein
MPRLGLLRNSKTSIVPAMTTMVLIKRVVGVGSRSAYRSTAEPATPAIHRSKPSLGLWVFRPETFFL